MSGGAQRIVIGVTAAAIALLVAQNSFAFTREQAQAFETKAEASPDSRIANCSAVIEKTKVKKQKIDALIERGKAYRAKGDGERAIRDFDEAIKQDGKHAEAYYNRGMTLRDRGEIDRALQDLEPTIKYNPKNTVALNTLSHVYYDKRDYEHAIVSLNLAIKLNPNNALAFFNRGMAYRAK